MIHGLIMAIWVLAANWWNGFTRDGGVAPKARIAANRSGVEGFLCRH